MKSSIVDLIDFERVNDLLEGFNKSTGFVTAVLDLDGNILSRSGWRHICTHFHRINSETDQRCLLSDTILAGKIANGEKYHFYQCMNGLVDVAVPIIINGEHLANLFSGQFFFEEPNRDAFIAQAQKYGFDQERYLQSLSEVPVFSEDQVKPVMDFLLNMTEMFTSMALQRLDQVHLNETLKESQEQLKIQNELLIKAKEQAEESNLLHSSMVHASMDGFWLTDIELNLLEVNEAYCEMSGYTEAELLTMRVSDLEAVESLEEITVRRQRSELIGSDRFETQHRRKDGSLFDVEVTLQYRSIGTGQVVVFIRNITERKEAIESLRNSKNFAENLIHTANVIIVGLNTKGEVEIFNETAERITGYVSADLKGKNWFETLVPKEKYPHVWKEFSRLAIDGKMPKTFENPILTKSGEERFISWQNGTLYENDQISGLISFGIDITKRKQTELALLQNQALLKAQNEELQLAKNRAEESDRLKTSFLQNMSHEIRTPLNSIVGFTELLTDPDSDLEQRNYYSELIFQSSNQLISIITDIINISTFEAGQEKINRTETNLNIVCNTVCEQLFSVAIKKELQLNCQMSLPDREAIILTDQTKLMQALSNLVGNALKFTTKGHVSFGYQLENDQIEFYVEDTGIGIPADKQADIFKRFHQLENNSTRKYGGSGLGLSISKAYVELLGGIIRVNSEMGKGSTFYFTIPYLQP